MSAEPRSWNDPSSSDRSPETQDDRTLRIDALLFEYIDRLNAGEILDPELIEGEHPELAETLIERLEVYQALGEPGDEVDLEPWATTRCGVRSAAAGWASCTTPGRTPWTDAWRSRSFHRV